MDLSEIQKIIDLMEERNISEFEMEREGFKISLKKGQPARLKSKGAAGGSGNMQTVPLEELSPAEEEAASKIEAIESPIVGTFYASASPESPPFVTVGQEVKENDVLCIIEAMKVMNEIQSEIAGTIVEILVKSGEPVEFGQPLYKIERA